MTTGDIEWRLKRAEEMLLALESDVWKTWHEKQLIRALAQKIEPIVGSMAKSRELARAYVFHTIPDVWEEIDYSGCLDPEEFVRLVDRWADGLIKEVTPTK